MVLLVNDSRGTVVLWGDSTGPPGVCAQEFMEAHSTHLFLPVDATARLSDKLPAQDTPKQGRIPRVSIYCGVGMFPLFNKPR